VAVDVPSGLDGGTGAIRGFAPQAELTVTFFRAKPGHLLFPGRPLCGTLLVADIGMPEAVLSGIDVRCFANQPGLWTLPPLGETAHKYKRGHVTVLGGVTMPGAARLATAAARRAGAGLVSIAAEYGADLYRCADAGALVADAPLAGLVLDPRRQVFLCGPGYGIEAAGPALRLLQQAGKTVVIDADALTACAADRDLLRGAAVLTPHEGEFTRLFGRIAPDRLSAARRAAAESGAVVVLKGPDTVIAAPDGRAAINANAPPWLATAGSGDVLAGVIAALLGQGMPAWGAACAGVWLHGRAATLAGAGLLAEDLPAHLPAARGDAEADADADAIAAGTVRAGDNREK
jgi:hydroxyethylthiazole kinase-like uncharacterized protein yjeF